MPQIAQQDYIRIPVLDENGEFSDDLCTDAIKAKFIEYAKNKTLSDVLLTSADETHIVKILGYSLVDDYLTFAIYDGAVRNIDIEF